MEEDLNASVISTTEADGSVKTRVCEYCEVKLDNPQIDQFYEYGKRWKQREVDMQQKKFEWYEEAINDLDAHLSKEAKCLT